VKLALKSLDAPILVVWVVVFAHGQRAGRPRTARPDRSTPELDTWNSKLGFHLPFQRAFRRARHRLDGKFAC
jgi:hypothetical protein